MGNSSGMRLPPPPYITREEVESAAALLDFAHARRPFMAASLRVRCAAAIVVNTDQMCSTTINFTFQLLSKRKDLMATVSRGARFQC